MLACDWLDVVGVVEVTCARGSLVSHIAVPGHTPVSHASLYRPSSRAVALSLAFAFIKGVCFHKGCLLLDKQDRPPTNRRGRHPEFPWNRR